MIEEYNYEEMDMPTPCERCQSIFDLNNGCASRKWYPNTVICRSCREIEDKELEIDDEIDDLKDTISNAEIDKANAEQRLVEIIRAEPWRNEANDIRFIDYYTKTQQNNDNSK